MRYGLRKNRNIRGILSGANKPVFPVRARGRLDCLFGIRYRFEQYVTSATIFLWLAWIGRPGASYLVFEVSSAILLTIIAFYRFHDH